jgi:glycerol dehydrogenase
MKDGRRLVAPSMYIQGRGATYYLGQRARTLGTKAYVIGGRTAISVTGDRIRKSLEANGIEMVALKDDVSDCTHATIDRLVGCGTKLEPHFVVGVGGGRAIDTAKAVAWKLGVPAISVGTQCATNADGSAESVVYTEDHRFLETLILPNNPAVVIVDTEIIAKAPVKYLVWGMGDALSTKFEAEAYAKAREKRRDGPVPTAVALTLANTTYQKLMDHGLKAVEDLRRGVHSEDVDEVIEAVKLSSAIAFENTGCALAHAIHNGLTKTGQVKGEHGEIVAYGTIVQAAYERRPDKEVRRMMEWCDRVGLPTKLKMIGNPSKAMLRKALDHACNKDENADSMPERPRPADVLKVMERIERGGL